MWIKSQQGCFFNLNFGSFARKMTTEQHEKKEKWFNNSSHVLLPFDVYVRKLYLIRMISDTSLTLHKIFMHIVKHFQSIEI